jgi:hypothetical protein
MATLFGPLVLPYIDLYPIAVFEEAVLVASDSAPIAVLLHHQTLVNNALNPLATLLLPVVLFSSDSAPIAELFHPVVFLDKLKAPKAILL